MQALCHLTFLLWPKRAVFHMQPTTSGPSASWYAAPFYGLMEYGAWIGGTLKDIATQYQEAGPDYLYALMTGYADEAPAGVDVGDQ